MTTGRWAKSKTPRSPPETSSFSGAATANAERAISAAMVSYNDVLNMGSIDAALALYAEGRRVHAARQSVGGR